MHKYLIRFCINGVKRIVWLGNLFGNPMDKGKFSTINRFDIVWKSLKNNFHNLLGENFKIAANGKFELGDIFTCRSPELWLIETFIGGKKEILKNHYIAGKRPLDLEKYKYWLKNINPGNWRL